MKRKLLYDSSGFPQVTAIKISHITLENRKASTDCLRGQHKMARNFKLIRNGAIKNLIIFKEKPERLFALLVPGP